MEQMAIVKPISLSLSLFHVLPLVFELHNNEEGTKGSTFCTLASYGVSRFCSQ